MRVKVARITFAEVGASAGLDLRSETIEQYLEHPKNPPFTKWSGRLFIVPTVHMFLCEITYVPLSGLSRSMLHRIA